MQSIDYCYWTVGVTTLYLFVLLIQKKYRILLPSNTFTFIWLATTLLMIFQLEGFLVSKKVDNSQYQFVSQFIFYLVLSSIVGFFTAHIISLTKYKYYQVELINCTTIDGILYKFKWIPYLCGIMGIILFAFLYNVAGNVTFSEYRMLALYTERTGLMSIIQRASGHAVILSKLYLLILGYKYGMSGINIRKFIIFFILCSSPNMAIGGRGWIISSIMPFLTTFILTRHYCSIPSGIRKKDNRNIIYIIIILVSLFSIIGILRSNPEYQTNGFDKYLYLTDGAKMTNMVLEQYPEWSFKLEYGKSLFLQPILDSPMQEAFTESLSDNIGLLVTVRSIMPNIYYDFGFKGGIIIWGVICFIIEYICNRLRYSKKIIPILIYGVASSILLTTPIGNTFATNTPVFEWIILIYIFRKWIFAKIPNIEQYL